MNVLQSLQRESEEAWKIYNLSLLFVYKVKLIFYQPSKEVYIVGLEPYPLSISFYDTTLGLFGLDGYVLLTQGGDHFTL